MSKLREAAQEALFWMQHARLHLTIKERLHPDGLIQYDNAARNLRAALAQPENRPCTCHPDDNPPQPCAQRYALTECKALAQPETAEPVAWAVTCDGNVTQTWLTEIAAIRIAENLREQNRGRDFDWQTTPLYAHPPRDEWRPASEPPEDGRDVVVWMNDGGHGCFAIGHCLRGEWTPNYVGSPVIRWRDVQPPTEVAK